MKVTIRKLYNTEHEYFAYSKSLCGKATYLCYFEDNIWGAVTLNNFIEMLKSFFKENRVEVKIEDKCIKLKKENLLEWIK